MSRTNKGIKLSFRKDRNCWEIIEFIGGKRKRHATGFSLRSDAEEKLAEIIVTRNSPQKNEQLLSLGEIIIYYINEHIPTLASPETALKCFDRLIPFWAEMKLNDIKKSKVFEYLEYRKKEYLKWQNRYEFKSKRSLSHETVRRELEQLQAAIGCVYRDNLIGSCPYVWKPEKSKPRQRWLTTGEAAALLNAARKSKVACDYLPLFILIGLYTGARSGAILSLRWHQIDLQRGYIDFRENQNSSIKASGIVPISKKLLLQLRYAKKRGSDIGHVIHCNQMPIKSVKKSFASACALAGLEDVTPHTLRHTAASWRVQRGVPLPHVAKYLGHSSTQMIEKVYGHLSPEHLKDAAER